MSRDQSPPQSEPVQPDDLAQQLRDLQANFGSDLGHVAVAMFELYICCKCRLEDRDPTHSEKSLLQMARDSANAVNAFIKAAVDKTS